MRIIFAGFVFFCLFSSCILETLQISNHANYYRGRKLKSADWCSLSCPSGDENIGCTYNGSCTPNMPCTLESLDEEQILDAHNKLRNDFAMGKDPRAAGIKVANMMALEWDDDLAFLASCNLKLCSEDLERDRCHITSEFSTAGQNLAMASSSDVSIDCHQKAYDQFTNDWYDEIKSLTIREIKGLGGSFSFQSTLGHFMQVVWAETTHIGCALTKKPGTMTTCMLACNYGPEGNMKGAHMFTEGEPCSACPENVPCNKKYPGLCGGATNMASPRASPFTPVTIPVMFVSLLVQNYF